MEVTTYYLSLRIRLAFATGAIVGANAEIIKAVAARSMAIFLFMVAHILRNACLLAGRLTGRACTRR